MTDGSTAASAGEVKVSGSTQYPNMEQGKMVGVNKYCDIGALMLEDCSSFAEKNEKQIMEITKANLCTLYKELFDMKREQVAAQGEDGEILEYTRPMFMVSLPPPRIVTPREKPIPKEKPMTKWEKFRLERGLPARKKRSRMVFDPISNDWVPRWGHNSKKAVEDKHNWLMEEKPGSDGTNPFTKLKQERKLV